MVLLVGSLISILYYICLFNALLAWYWFLITPLAALIFLRQNFTLYWNEKLRLFNDEILLICTLDASHLYSFQAIYRSFPSLFRPLFFRIAWFVLLQLFFLLTELFLLPSMIFFIAHKFYLFSFQILFVSAVRIPLFEHVYISLCAISHPIDDQNTFSSLNVRLFGKLLRVLFSVEAEDFAVEMAQYCRIQNELLTTSQYVSSSTSMSVPFFSFDEKDMSSDDDNNNDNNENNNNNRRVSMRHFIQYMLMKTLHMPTGSLCNLINYGASVLMADERVHEENRGTSLSSLGARDRMKMTAISGLTLDCAEDDHAFWQTHPLNPDEAMQMKGNGACWSNAETRRTYLRRIAMIPSMLQQRDQQHGSPQSAEGRARLASDIRHRARVTARAMMSDPDRVVTLKIRDLTKYAAPDGPTFAWLVASMRRRGKEGDEIFRAIEESAMRSNEAVNSFFSFLND